MQNIWKFLWSLEWVLSGGLKKQKPPGKLCSGIRQNSYPPKVTAKSKHKRPKTSTCHLVISRLTKQVSSSIASSIWKLYNHYVSYWLLLDDSTLRFIFLSFYLFLFQHSWVDSNFKSLFLAIKVKTCDLEHFPKILSLSKCTMSQPTRTRFDVQNVIIKIFKRQNIS